MSNMHDHTGWAEVDCATADEHRGAQPVTPGSSLTDLDGEYGPAVMYTEWWNKDSDEPVLRDYMWEPLGDSECRHYIPVSQ